ncbi:hypothetical protein CRENBAI_002579 [Crenichthys baileyi]|uniref:Uncharacterized protein n=1 Tax=Crenichthys baileyi TaxID=28760 RepID=A0AAV9RNQ2_9TELE
MRPKSPSRIMESPGGAQSSTPRQGCQEGRVLRTTPRPIGRNDSQRPVPNPKVQGYDPLIHWAKPQHETAELGGNKQTHPSPPPLPVGHSRVEESPALLVEMGSRAHAVRGGEPDYFYSISLDLPHKLRLLPPQ